jgi:hypothetical protein
MSPAKVNNEEEVKESEIQNQLYPLTDLNQAIETN